MDGARGGGSAGVGMGGESGGGWGWDKVGWGGGMSLAGEWSDREGWLARGGVILKKVDDEQNESIVRD